MAARKDRFATEATRAKIRAAYLIRRLQDHVKGKISLTPTQVRSAEILLRKIVPDLTQTSVVGEMMHKYVAEVPPLLTKDAWLEKYRVTKQEQPKVLDLKPTPALPAPVKNGHDQ